MQPWPSPRTGCASGREKPAAGAAGPYCRRASGDRLFLLKRAVGLVPKPSKTKKPAPAERSGKDRMGPASGRRPVVTGRYPRRIEAGRSRPRKRARFTRARPARRARPKQLGRDFCMKNGILSKYDRVLKRYSFTYCRKQIAGRKPRGNGFKPCTDDEATRCD